MKRLCILLSCALCLPALAEQPAPKPSGMTVVRDPATGTMRAPTGPELRALQGSVPQPAPSTPSITVRPDGSRTAVLGERGMVYSSATRNADGSITHRCAETADGHAKGGDHAH